MANYCRLTGVNLDEEKCPIKKMCLNCEDLIVDGDTYRCDNEKVNEAGKKRVIESLPEGFEVESLTLKPYLLKDPTKKCSNYSVYKGIDAYLHGILGD